MIKHDDDIKTDDRKDNFDEFSNHLLHGWLSYINDNENNFLKYGTKLLKFATSIKS